MSTSSTHKSSLGAALQVSLVAAFRVLIFAFAIHFGGVIHGAIDLVRTCEAVALHESDDCGDGEDHCPADCPNCHCSHGGSQALPPRAPAADIVIPDAPIAVQRFVESSAPPDRPLPSLFRPPRPALS